MDIRNPSPGLYNEDLAPTRDRRWGAFSIFNVWTSDTRPAAARQLALSQPTVTTQIRALEEHYGVELFHRQGGRLSITDAGLRLLAFSTSGLRTCTAFGATTWRPACFCCAAASSIF